MTIQLLYDWGRSLLRGYSVSSWYIGFEVASRACIDTPRPNETGSPTCNSAASPTLDGRNTWFVRRLYTTTGAAGRCHISRLPTSTGQHSSGQDGSPHEWTTSVNIRLRRSDLCSSKLPMCILRCCMSANSDKKGSCWFAAGRPLPRVVATTAQGSRRDATGCKRSTHRSSIEHPQAPTAYTHEPRC